MTTTSSACSSSPASLLATRRQSMRSPFLTLKMALKSTLHSGHLLQTFAQPSMQAKQNLCRQSGSMPQTPEPSATSSPCPTEADAAVARRRLLRLAEPLAPLLRAARHSSALPRPTLRVVSHEVAGAEVDFFDRLAHEHAVVVVDDLVDAGQVDSLPSRLLLLQSRAVDWRRVLVVVEHDRPLARRLAGVQAVCPSLLLAISFS